jgi:ABC-type transport system substrate-binding protein
MAGPRSEDVDALRAQRHHVVEQDPFNADDVVFNFRRW